MQINLARNDDGAPEIFRSIQGEGPMAGRERTFIRLSGCNLHCRWCDTAYTWNWEGSPFAHESGKKYRPAEEMEKLSVAEAAAAVLALPAEGVVITGGEPMVQRAALRDLIQKLRAGAPGLRIEMETNGALAPSAELAALVDLFVVSPKLAHSGNDAALALNAEALAAFAALDQAHFKFVCQTPADADAAAAIAAQHNIAPARVSLMPEGVSSETIRARLPALADAARAHGFSVSDRLHIHQFGQKRGI
ncbi:MAG TPA: 7-carboxy-7-deazaguanine synthase QueE [Terricaulis sp.]|nr:7-carboxy-7-deazaguanine synthase QueE [Terricaulis sp.]